MDRWDLNSIEQAFAEAAVDPALWPHAMEVAAEATESRGTLLFPHPDTHPDGNLPIIPPTPSLLATNDVYMADGWWQRDERTRAWPKILSSGVATDFDVMSADEMKRHPYYQEFLVPRGFRWFAGVLLDDGKGHWCLQSSGPASKVLSRTTKPKNSLNCRAGWEVPLPSRGRSALPPWMRRWKPMNSAD